MRVETLALERDEQITRTHGTCIGAHPFEQRLLTVYFARRQPNTGLL